MGGTQVRRSLTLPLNLSDYEEVRVVRGRFHQPPFRLLRNIHTSFEVQEYRLYFDSEADFRRYEDSFQWRLSQPCVVNTVYFAEETRREFCTSSYAGTLFTEHIPLKLSEIKDIPWPDNLYILSASLEGFSQLYTKIGYFPIQEYMICINKQGKARVWVSDDLSKITPDEVEVIYQGDERDMVRRIVELLDLNTDISSQQQSVQGYFNKHDPMPRFGEARRLVKQMALEHNTTVPTSFDCIMDILNSDMDEPRTRRDDSERLSIRKSKRHTPRRQQRKIHQHHPPSTVRQSVRQSDFEEEDNTLHPHNNNRTIRHTSNIKVDSEPPNISQGIPVLNRYQPLIMRPGQFTRNLHMAQPFVHSNYPMQQVHVVQSVERPNIRFLSPTSIGSPERVQLVMHPQPEAMMVPIIRKAEPNNERHNYKSYEPTYRRSPSVHVIEPAQDHHRNRNRTTHYHTDSQITGNLHIAANNDGYVSDTTNVKSKRPGNSDRHPRQPKEQSPKRRKPLPPVETAPDIPDKPNFTKKIVKRKAPPPESSEDDRYDLSKLVMKMDNEQLDNSNQFNYRVNIVEGPFRRSNLNAVKNSYPISRHSIAFSQPAHNTTNLVNNFSKNFAQLKEHQDETVKDRTELLERKTKLNEAINLMRDTIKGAETLVTSPRMQDRNKQKLTTEAKNYYAYKYDHALDPQIAFDLMQKGL